MKTFLLHIILIFIICCLWLSCRDDRTMERVYFGNMDSLLEANPDSAYKLLIAKQKDVDSLSDKSVSMRQRMYLADAENKLYLPMPSDSSFMDVVSYYDAHGTPNDRMLAYYLLGCIYRDLKEAPMAIHYFEEAAECADTLSPDCDYATMLRIYYQMGILYYYQYFPDKTLECYRLMSHYSLKAGDTYNSIRSIELQADPYYIKADSAKVLEMTDSAYHLYVLNKMPENAVRVFPHAIYIHINRGEYEEARKLMDQFEKGSGLFDSDGKIIEKGYGRYDYARGLYSLWQGETVQAQEYFHRLLENGYESEAYDGFARIYRILSNPDSVYKYVELSDKVLSAQLSSMQIQAITLSNSLYDYNRLQRTTDLAVIHSERTKKWLWFTVMSSILLTAFLFYRHHLRKKETEQVKSAYSELSRQHGMLQSERESLCLSLTELRTSTCVQDKTLRDLADIVRNKEAEISNLSEKMEKMRTNYSVYLSRHKILEFYGCDSVKSVFSHCNPYPQETASSDHFWDRLLEDTRLCLPDLYMAFTNHDLSRQRMIISVLIVIGLKAKQISLFLGSSLQNISRQESCINQILFRDSTSKTLKRNLMGLCN